MKLAVGITGASGVQLGLKFLKMVPDSVEVHAIISNSAKFTLKQESDKVIKEFKNITFHSDDNLGSAISSGSFGLDRYIIIPCSMNTLAKCSVGISDTLITRVFGVMLKERKQITISPREMPFNTLQLEAMAKLSSLGVTVAPPVIGYYSQQQTLEDMENFLIGKLMDTLNIENNLYKRWDGEK